MYLQFTCTVLVALCVRTDEKFETLHDNTVKYTFFSAFAISVTLLIARIRNVISSSNMIMGVDLSLALWTGGMYAIAMAIRTLKLKKFKEQLWSSKLYIAEIIICSILLLASWVWAEIFPDPGGGEINLCNLYETSGVRLLPGGPIVSAVKVAVSVVAIAVAVVPRRKRTLDWLKWASCLLVVLYLAGLITMIELISVMVFQYKVENLGLGQIIALCLETAQILEVCKVAHDGGWPVCVSGGAGEARFMRMARRLSTGRSTRWV